jgi:trigger factor
MQVSIETTSGLERRLTVGVPAATVDNEVDARLRKAVKDVRLPGFRPGKVPMKVMHQRFGPGVRQDVIGDVVSRSFQEAIVQEQLRPAGPPSIEPRSTVAGRDLEYVATFEVFPEIALVDLSGFGVERPQAGVTDDDIDNIIEVFRKQQGTWEIVERPAADGDKVVIDFRGTRDGEEFDGGSAEGSQLELGSGRMIPGFESGIVGMQAGQEKTLALTFPEDYHEENLRGAAVEFAVTLHEVQELQLAPLDASLFAAYGVEGDDVDAFRAEVAQNMERELRNAVEARVKQQVLDKLAEAYAGVDIPQALVAQETDALRRQMMQQFGGSLGKDIDLRTLLPDDMFAERARRRVRLGLVLAELIRHYELKADADAVRAEVEEIASTYQEPEEVVNWYYANQDQLAAIESHVLEDAVIARVLEQTDVVDSPCSYQEAIALGQQQARAA